MKHLKVSGKKVYKLNVKNIVEREKTFMCKVNSGFTRITLEGKKKKIKINQESAYCFYETSKPNLK